MPRRTIPHLLSFVALLCCGTAAQAADCWRIRIQGVSTNTEYELLAFDVYYQPFGGPVPGPHAAARGMVPGTGGALAAERMREGFAATNAYTGWGEHICLSLVSASPDGNEGTFTVLDTAATGTLEIVEHFSVPGLTVEITEHPPSLCPCDAPFAVPAVGVWGVLILTLVLLIGGRLFFGRPALTPNGSRAPRRSARTSDPFHFLGRS